MNQENNINNLREQIDNIDDKLIKLFEQRMLVAGKVGQYKLENNLPIFDSSREEIILQDKTKKLVNQEYNAYCTEFFKNLMDISKDLQAKIISSNNNKNTQNTKTKVAYQGVVGAFGEQAAINYFDDFKNNITTQKINCESFEEVFQKVASGEAEAGILPIENSTGGTIYQVYDFFEKYNCFITGEYILRVEHALLGVKGAKLSDIKTIYSHEQGFLQCTDFLNSFDFKRVNYKNTAASAQYISELNNKCIGAIASARTAEIYNLEVLQNKINNNQNNMTRFVAISKKLDMQKQKSKVSMAFNLKHECGSLHAVLAHLAKKGFSLTKIESRMLQNKTFEYRFYIDLEGALDETIISSTINELRALALDFRLVGYYDPFLK